MANDAFGKAIQLLRQLEWTGHEQPCACCDWETACPICRRYHPDVENARVYANERGHRPDCALAALIAGAKDSQDDQTSCPDEYDMRDATDRGADE